MNHEQLKQSLIEQGKQQGMTATELKVLSRDPFFVGSTRDYEEAKWAAGLWDIMMASRRKSLHLRGFHYWIQSQGIPKPDGIKYAYGDPKTSKEEQDKAPSKDWGFLLKASQTARYLGIGKWENLVDFKHPEPKDYDNYWVGSGLSKSGEIDIQTELNSKLEGLVNEFLQELLHNAPRYSTEGYQTTHLEVWCEKNSMGFVIEPACRKYDACYQALVGQSSVEKVSMSFDRAVRAARAGKKVRLFYISDYDRYGRSMVPAVARKIEYFKLSESVDMDIKVCSLALLEEQINKFKLPYAPKHGEEVVELDALEAIHPGALGKIVEQALKPYYDSEKPAIVEAENRRIREQVRQMLEEKLQQPLQEAFAGIDIEGFAGELSLADAINPEFEPPEPGHDTDDSDRSWVYDSKRSYWSQWNEYKKYKASGEEES